MLWREAERAGLSKLGWGHFLAIVHNRFLPLDLTKASMSFSPERRKSRKFTPEYLHVWQMLRRIRSYSILFGDDIPPMTRRSLAKALIACSALLLFQGTPS